MSLNGLIDKQNCGEFSAGCMDVNCCSKAEEQGTNVSRGGGGGDDDIDSGQ